jgi:hypothetical protein
LKNANGNDFEDKSEVDPFLAALCFLAFAVLGHFLANYLHL